MNVLDELKRVQKQPFCLTEKEFDTYYANLYSVLALEGRASKSAIILLIEDAVEMYRLREAGYDKEISQ